MTTDKIKDVVVNSITEFLDHSVSGFNNPGFKIIYNKIKKNIVKNVTNSSGKLFKYVSLLEDESGNIDFDIYDEFIKAMKTVPRKEYNMEFCSIIVDNGTVSISVPDNILSDWFLDGVTTMTFKDNDFIKLKEIITNNITKTN